MRSKLGQLQKAKIMNMINFEISALGRVICIANVTLLAAVGFLTFFSRKEKSKSQQGTEFLISQL